MLNFYRSSRLEILADHMMEQVSGQPLSDPLASEVIIVQNHGMARWISTRMARKLGISGNLQFPFPAEKIWDFYRLMDPDIPQNLPSDRDPMTWAIYQELQQLPHEPPFQTVWRYIRGDENEPDPLKTWKLATRIADLFDQYLVYRPQMLMDWQNKRTDSLKRRERWQAALWKKLNKRWRDLSEAEEGKTRIHRAEIHEKFTEAVQAGTIDEERLPERLILFGLSSLPPSTIDTFVKVSSLTEIHWFWMNPVEKHVFPSLSESWGGEGNEFLKVLKERIEKSSYKLITKNLDKLPEKYISEGKDTIDLFNQPEYVPKLSAPRVQVHSCHSAQREVEVLHDRILSLFDENPNLEPEDLLILTPDIQAYAPFIKGVFGHSESELPSIPFHIVDDHTGTQKEISNIFLRLLQLLDSRFKVTEVFDLLTSRIIRQRFDISEDELDRIHQWIDDTRVRWGLNGGDKQKMGLPGTEQFTWLLGLDRLMLGYSSQMDEEVFEGIYPSDMVEGGDDAELLGRFSRFLTKLKEARESSRKEHNMARWIHLLGQWVDQFIPSNNQYYRGYKQLKTMIEQLNDASKMAGFDQEVSYTVLLDYITNKLSASSQGGYFGHGITFSGLDQMRNIPFKVIGLIGMNSEAFPRTKQTPDFDLMTRNSQPGDRIRRNDDRYLFLETIQSAREHLYLSYVGQSDRDDSTRPPSAMVSELVDLLVEKEGGDKQRKDFITQHPLHSYSQSYFSGEKGALFTYSSRKWNVNKAIAGNARQALSLLTNAERLPEADESYRQVGVDDLVRFLQAPAQFLLINRLGIDFREKEQIEEDREPFALDSLEKYKLEYDLLNRALEQKSLVDYEPIARARGMLPDGWPGRETFRQKTKEITSYSLELHALFEQPKIDAFELDINEDGFHLTGLLDDLYADYQMLLRYGNFRGKDLLKLWVYHLAYQQAEEMIYTKQSLLIGKKKQEPIFAKLPPLEKGKAGEYLANLLELYWKGLHEKIPLFTETSYAYARAIIEEDKDHPEALKKAEQKWKDSYYGPPGEGSDPFINILYDNIEVIDSQSFKDLSIKVWEPVLLNLERMEALDA